MIAISLVCRTNNVCGLLLRNLRPNITQCQPAAGIKSLEERVGLPPKPKKPLTPFFRYMKEMRPKLSAENPQLKLTEIVKMISKNWDSLDPSAKQKLQEQYRSEQAKYVEIRSKYDSKITDEQRLEMKQIKQNVEAIKEKRLNKKRIAALDRPKKPASAFIVYITNQKKIDPPKEGQAYRDWMESIAKKWAQLSDSEKDKYLKAGQEKLAVYKQELLAWEQKMIRLGNVDVVRQK